MNEGEIIATYYQTWNYFTVNLNLNPARAAAPGRRGPGSGWYSKTSVRSCQELLGLAHLTLIPGANSSSPRFANMPGLHVNHKVRL